jgi:hypothetical protein
MYSCQNAAKVVTFLLMSSWNPAKGGPGANNRRSQRVILSLAVTVRTEEGARGRSFSEDTQTLVVNAHGALVALDAHVEKGQILYLTNRAVHEEQKVRVIYVGPTSGGKAQVGVEFATPCPDFWRIAFPPEDWSAPEPEPPAGKAQGSPQSKTAIPAKKP